MEQREIIYLGALLHDIGKFTYRAQPTKEGDNHEKLGDEFSREYITTKIAAFQKDSEKIQQALNRSSSKVLLADHIAAAEREDQKSRQTRRPLVSVFSRVDIGMGKPPNDIYYHEPKPLELYNNQEYEKAIEEELNLKKVENTSVADWKINDDEMIELHKQYYESFKKEFSKVQEGSFQDARAALTTIYSLLWKYTSNVCSAGYKSYPDISLFDHSRNVAAIALCFEESDSDKECLLIKGDISGIQKFIYEEIKETSGAAKKLRGRSFYIKLLADATASYISRELNLYEASIFFNGGGHFVIIAPNNKKNRERIAELEKEINLTLLNMFGPSLQIALVYLEEKAENVVKKFDKVSDELNIKLRNVKKRKSFSILKEVLNYKKNNEQVEVDFESIGTQIPHARYLIEVFSEKMPDAKYNDCISFPRFKSYWKIVNSGKYLEIALSEIKETEPERCIIYSIRHTNILKNVDLTKKYEFPIAFSFKFIATYAPSDEDGYGVLEFSKLAAKGTPDNPLLAVLRMDVDNLGRIFRDGLKIEKEQVNNKKDENNDDDVETLYSISRLGTLSRELDMFFTKTINVIAKRFDIYITYSGGDDLFAVGSWINIVDFALEVRKQFEKLCNFNPNITISGGTSISKSDFPLAKLALIAEQSEKRAKDGFKYSKSEYNKLSDIEKFGKDKIDVFNTVVYWNEFKEKIEFARKLYKAVTQGEGKSDDISPSFLYRLLALTRECFDRRGRFRIAQMHRLTANLHYLFARRKLTEEQIQKETDEIKKKLAHYFLKSSEQERRRWFETFILPASYVILKKRKIKS